MLSIVFECAVGFDNGQEMTWMNVIFGSEYLELGTEEVLKYWICNHLFL